MRIWSHLRGAHGASAVDPRTAPGGMPCSEEGCTAATGLHCGYVDRRGRACDTAWCPEHRAVLDGSVVCRRHFGTMAGLHGAPVHLPDLDNRAPSLVAWIGRRLEPSITAVLAGHALGGAEVGTVPVHAIHTGRDRIRVWERSWSVVGDGGRRLSVVLEVSEEDPTRLVLRVGRSLLAHVVPPWIEHREAGVELPPDVEEAHRQDFYESLRQLIAGAVAHEAAAHWDTVPAGTVAWPALATR